MKMFNQSSVFHSSFHWVSMEYEQRIVGNTEHKCKQTTINNSLIVKPKTLENRGM